ncbi:MAG TPA: protein kinase, partial [Gemmatimonadaceae bacterium]|nr:protein kinase [Gemmatimonadaceae bacterium]
AAVKIKSEHVARVSDVGTLETGAPYIVMEFLEGCDLAAWLRQQGPLPIDQAVEFVLQACEAVAEAHSLGIIHRDLKPANLFVTRRNDGVLSIKVLDFGISKYADAGDLAGTQTSTIMGSPYYMSPEQMRSSRDVDPTSDIWAIGIILYELLAGKTPFMAETFSEVCVRVATEPPAPLQPVRPDVPPGLEATIAKCLKKDRRSRFGDVADLAFALREFAPRRAAVSIERISGILRRSPVPLMAQTAYAPSETISATMSPFGRTTAHRNNPARSSLRAALALALLSATCVILVAAFLVRRGAPAADTTNTRAESPPQQATSSRVAAAPGTDTATAAEIPPQLPVDPVPAPPETSRIPETPAVHAGPGHHGVHLVSPGAATAVPAKRAGPAANAAPTAVAMTAGGATAGGATAAPSAAPPPEKAQPADCDPPYYFDNTGIRIFKPECVR